VTRLGKLREYVRILSQDYGDDIVPPGLGPEVHLRVADELRSLLHDRLAVLIEGFFFPPCVLAELANWPVVYVRSGTWYERNGDELVVPVGRSNEQTALNLLEAIAARAFRERRLFATRSDHVLLAIELGVPLCVVERFDAEQILRWQTYLPRRIVVMCCRRARRDEARRARSGIMPNGSGSNS
jgi:hypothetical protein